jgi:hypothetical protein
MALARAKTNTAPTTEEICNLDKVLVPYLQFLSRSEKRFSRTKGYNTVHVKHPNCRAYPQVLRISSYFALSNLSVEITYGSSSHSGHSQMPSIICTSALPHSHALTSRAYSITISSFGFPLSSDRATLAPLIPLPMITTSASWRTVAESAPQ